MEYGMSSSQSMEYSKSSSESMEYSMGSTGRNAPIAPRRPRDYGMSSSTSMESTKSSSEDYSRSSSESSERSMSSSESMPGAIGGIGRSQKTPVVSRLPGEYGMSSSTSKEWSPLELK
eukprot:TRINITY_DN1178_c0_g1_i5.p1 TRINITY_DN1178_c0_g1~~TRINITY_DN1178_c0_g1_i5.p1  ORF type:complete len:118 (+),score=3.51 TRINITY_DN1178_c0_g1_i5:237-590(+)